MSADFTAAEREALLADGTTTFELLEAVARRMGTHTCVVDGETALTYAEFVGYCRQIAAGLAGLGVAIGDRVALWMVNSIEWLAADFACGLLGAVVVPLNTRLTEVEVAKILTEAAPAVLIIDRVFRGRDRWDEVTGMALSPPPIVVVRAEAGTVLPPGALGFSELANQLNADHLEVSRVPSDANAYLLYTSGTTSTPKGVMLRHANVTAIGPIAGDATDLVADDRVLVGLPLYSSFGCITVKLGCVSHGAAMVLLDEFSPRRAVEAICDKRITMFYGVDTMVRDMASLVDSGELARPASLWRAAVIPVTRAIIDTLGSSLGVQTVYSGYGLTEASAASAFYRVRRDASNANVLKPLPGVEFQVRAEVPGGRVGELWLRSPGVMRGYYLRPDDTAAVLQPGGWLRTGDLAEVTLAGDVLFLGRIKDIIRTGGFNVAPLEVEDVLRQHPDVADAAVVGVPDERLGEVGMAFVRARPGRTVTPDAVLSFCRTRLADFKVPRSAVVVDEFPMTGSGKVQKGRLRDDYLGAPKVVTVDESRGGS